MSETKKITHHRPGKLLTTIPNTAINLMRMCEDVPYYQIGEEVFFRKELYPDTTIYFVSRNRCPDDFSLKDNIYWEWRYEGISDVAINWYNSFPQEIRYVI